jgi:FdhE protein
MELWDNSAAMALKSTSSRESPWQRRIERAQELQTRPSTAVEPLRFYELVLRFQAGVAEDCYTAFDGARSLREQVDCEFAASKVGDVLDLASNRGPEELANYARQLRKRSRADWRSMLESAIVKECNSGPLNDFLTRACIQPIAEKLQTQIPPNTHDLRSVCPACGGPPQLSILRPEGEGASRSLLCSFCLREWAFRRIICPSCDEEDKEKLVRYSAPECGHVLVEACESCRMYLKSVDMTVDGHAEPLVDEAAVAALDIWATERGYRKIARNLIGF